MAKQQYTCIIFFENREPAKYRRVTNMYNLWKYAQKNLSPRVTAVNCYHQEYKQFVIQLRTIQQAFTFTFNR